MHPWRTSARIIRKVSPLVTLLLALCGVAHGQSVIFLPQLPAGGDVTAAVTFVNTNQSSTVTGTFSVFNQNGTARAIAVDGRPTAATFAVTIPAGGTTTLVTTRGGTLSVGMGRFASDLPAAAVVRYELAGSQIGALNSPALANGTLVINTADGNDTGVALANPGNGGVNIRLVHAAANGQVLQTIDHPELNPLPGNGQVAKFVREFGFTQVNNKTGETIQIQTTAGGKFTGLGLLLRNGLLASTAVVQGAAGKFALPDFNRGYSGVWRNTTFGSEGTISLTMAVNLIANLVVINMSLTGNVFGGSAPGPTTLVGTYSDNGFTASGESSTFGPVTVTIAGDGSWTFTANNVPSTAVASMRITGIARPDRITGDSVITFRSGAPQANGTVTMNSTGQ